MKGVNALCHECGFVEVDLVEVVLRVEDEESAYFTLDCPGCGRGLWGRISTIVAAHLNALGASVRHGVFSPELLERRPGAPFTEDDARAWEAFLARSDSSEAIARYLQVGET